MRSIENRLSRIEAADAAAQNDLGKLSTAELESLYGKVMLRFPKHALREHLHLAFQKKGTDPEYAAAEVDRMIARNDGDAVGTLLRSLIGTPHHAELHEHLESLVSA